MANQYDEILPPLTSEDKMLAGLCYPFWGVVPFFVLASSKREDPFLLFHAMQGLALGLLTTLVSVVGTLFLWISFSSLPTSYMITSGLIGVLLVAVALGFGAFSFALSIFFGWQASSGRFLRMFAVGDLCEARMASMLNLTAAQLRALAVDRELVPDEKITILQPITTPEQMQAEMDRWSQPSAPAPSWWGAGGQAPAPPSTPSVATPPPPSPPAPEVRAWKPPAAAATETRRETKPEVKPWKPAPAAPTPQAKPVSFPSVSRPEPEEAKKKWWVPKEG
jgi:uncharacterized membrane protein